MTNSNPELKTAEAADSRNIARSNPQSPQSAEQEISDIFQTAVERLDRIDTNARGQKMKVVQDLAKDLEGKIPTDTIATEIIHQLRGKVSERFIHECLDEKYKRKHRVDNGKKQKHTKQIPDTMLAEVAPLKQTAIIVDAAGIETAPIVTHSKDHKSMDYEVLRDEKQGPEKCRNCDLLEQKYEQLRLKLVDCEDIVRTQTSIRTADEIQHSTDGCLEFQFSIPFETLRLHMTSSFNLNKSVNRVWFTCKLNPEKAKVVNVQILNITTPNCLDDTLSDTTRSLPQ